MNAPHDHNAPAEEERPPILGSWRNLYVAVLLGLAAMILACALLARLYP